jgi:hypothetical protein
MHLEEEQLFFVRNPVDIDVVLLEHNCLRRPLNEKSKQEITRTV